MEMAIKSSLHSYPGMHPILDSATSFLIHLFMIDFGNGTLIIPLSSLEPDFSTESQLATFAPLASLGNTPFVMVKYWLCTRSWEQPLDLFVPATPFEAIAEHVNLK